MNTCTYSAVALGAACLASACGGESLSTPSGIIVAADQNSEAITVDQGFVYWTTATSVMRMSIETDELATLVDGLASARPWWIAVNAGFVYWVNSGDPFGNDGSIMKVPVGGGMATVLATGIPSPTGIAVDDARVYWTNSGSVMTVPIGGGQVEPLAFSERGALGLTVDATHVYWVNADARQVRRISKAAGAQPETLTSALWPYGISVDATHVYWTNYNEANDGGSVMRVPLDGGAPTTIATGTENAWYIRVDDKAVYWATRTEIMKSDLVDGQVVTIADFAIPHGIAVGDTDVYWASASIENDPPAIRKIAK